MSPEQLDLFEAGNPAFLSWLDRVSDPTSLRKLARRWFRDRRPGPRSLLLAYLERPLNVFHEPLVIRLLRQALRARDDEVMAGMMRLFDRSLRREWKVRRRDRRSVCVLRPWPPIPRGVALGDAYLLEDRVLRLNSEQRAEYEAYRLFTVPTRCVLRRRVWRYFWKLGKEHPERYVAALAPVLKRYTPRDVAGGQGFLDNWGLMHVLFHHSEVIRPRRRGRFSWMVLWWTSTGELSPAPAHEALWAARPGVLLDILRSAGSEPVRDWAGRLLRRQSPATLAALLPGELLRLLTVEDRQIVCHAAEILRSRGGLEAVPVRVWVDLLRRGPPEVRSASAKLAVHWPNQAVEELANYALNRGPLPLEDAVELACVANSAVAALAFDKLANSYLDGRPLTEEQIDVLFRLVEAPVDGLRREMASALRRALNEQQPFRTAWVRLFLDARHAEVRQEGWDWFLGAPFLRDDVELWRWLVRSPAQDVRDKLLRHLDRYQAGQPGVLGERLPLGEGERRVLWARVLLTTQAKWGRPVQLAQMLADRLEWKSEDAPHLLPMLAEVLERCRGPAWRIALAAVVSFAERHPQERETVERLVPGLELDPGRPA